MRNKPEYWINEELIRRYRQGDEEALKILIKRFHPRLISKVFYYTRDRDSAEDLVQECWLAIIKDLGHSGFQIGFEPWAFTIARNKAIDWIRARQRERLQEKKLKIEVAFEQEETKAQKLPKKALIEKLRESIAMLPNTQRMILTLFYLEGYSLKEITEILHISTGTVKSRLFNAREQLKQTIKL